jgi:hypothetical protein
LELAVAIQFQHDKAKKQRGRHADSIGPDAYYWV